MQRTNNSRFNIFYQHCTGGCAVAFPKFYSVNNIVSLKNVGVAIAMNVPLRYCPHCGADLADLIRQQTKAFDDAADAVSHLIAMR